MAERRRGGKEREKGGKACVSVSTRRYFLCTLHISPKCQGSGRQALSGKTTHMFSLQKTMLGNVGWYHKWGSNTNGGCVLCKFIFNGNRNNILSRLVRQCCVDLQTAEERLLYCVHECV